MMVNRLKAAARWGAACCALALLAACQTPLAPEPHTGLLAHQVQVLRDQGFKETGEGWQLEMPGRLLFTLNSDALNAPLRDNVDRMGRALHGVGIDRLRVEGHADNQGEKAYNEELSLRRAHAVAQVLVDAGMPPQNVEVKAFGSSRPLVPNNSEEDRQQNRRVAIVVPVQ